MKTIMKTSEPSPTEEVDINCTFSGGLVHLHVITDRRSREYLFDPAQAVKLWRCLIGECETAFANDIHDDTMKLWYRVDPKMGHLWEFDDPAGERQFCLDADQAMALAWSVKACCSFALCVVPPSGERPYDHVWVLASKRMLTGDCAENGAEQLGGTERVFLARKAALGALREFLRPLVNACHTEAHWENLRGPGYSRSVDDVLNDILDEDGHPDSWMYDGTEQSFEVTLSRIKVERHGADPNQGGTT